MAAPDVSMPDSSAADSAVNAAGASQPMPNLTAPSPQAPQQAAPAKPSLWKNVVAGALAGLANSGGATSFGAGLGRGAAGELARERQIKDDATAATQQQGVQQQQMDEHQKSRVQTATAYANLSEINHRIALLPPDRQTQLIEQEADNTAAELKTGEIAQTGQPTNDWHEAQNQVTQMMQQNPAQLFIAKPIKGENGKIQYQVFAANDSLTQADATITTPDGKTVTVPKGSVTGKALQQARISALGETVKDHTHKATTDLMNAESNRIKANAAAAAAQAKKDGNNPTDWKPKVTADQKKKADLSENIAVNAEEVAKLLQKRPDLVGAIGGRFTNFQQLVGNNDPDISAIATHIHNIAMANSGVHGFRSHEGVKDNEQTLFNSFKNGPRAVGGSLKASVDSVQTFIDAARPEGYKTHSKQGGVLKGMSQ